MKKTNTKKLLSSLTVALALIALTLNACALTSLQTEPSSTAVEDENVVERVTLEDSKSAFDSGEAVFLDVRSESSFASSHIPDALSIPLDELEARIDEIDPTLWVITYCT
jgi:3-mercaptopyruvate sulfurtransferase SseA